MKQKRGRGAEQRRKEARKGLQREWERRQEIVVEWSSRVQQVADSSVTELALERSRWLVELQGLEMEVQRLQGCVLQGGLGAGCKVAAARLLLRTMVRDGCRAVVGSWRSGIAYAKRWLLEMAVVR